MEDSEGDTESQAVDYGCKDDERRCLAEFCSSYMTNRYEVEALRKQKKELAEAKRALHDALLRYMKDNSVTCVPVSIKGEEKQKYLRLQSKSSRRQICPSTIEEAIFKLNGSIVRSAVQRLRTLHSRDPTVFEVLVESIIQSTNETCTYKRDVVSISSSKERDPVRGKKRQKIRPEDAPKPHILPKDVCKIAYRFYKTDRELAEKSAKTRRLNSDLRAMTRDLPVLTQDDGQDEDARSQASEEAPKSKRAMDKEEKEQRHMEHQESREVLSRYINRIDPEKKSVKLEVADENGTSGAMWYSLREKTVGTVKPFPTSRYREVVEACVRQLFQESTVDEKFQDSHITDLTDQTMLQCVAEEIIMEVQRYRESATQKTRSITLDKVVDRKRKLMAEDGEGFENNVLDYEPSDDDA
jgi:hypothetical protein